MNKPGDTSFIKKNIIGKKIHHAYTIKLLKHVYQRDLTLVSNHLRNHHFLLNIGTRNIFSE